MAQYHDAESAMDIDAFMALVVEEFAIKKYGFWTFDETEVFLEYIYIYMESGVCHIIYYAKTHTRIEEGEAVVGRLRWK